MSNPHEPEVEEFKVDTAVAKVSARGQVSIVLTAICAAEIAFLAGVFLAHTADAKDDSKAVRAAMAEHSKAIRAQTRAICIVSRPLALQEREFTDPNSFCRRMAELP